MLRQAALSDTYWVEAVQQSITIKNLAPRRDWMTPFEKLTGKQPRLTNMKTFGCLAMVHRHESQRGKHEPRGDLCVYLGSQFYNVYRVQSLRKQTVTSAQHVTFHESKFPVKDMSESDSASEDQRNTQQYVHLGLPVALPRGPTSLDNADTEPVTSCGAGIVVSDGIATEHVTCSAPVIMASLERERH